MFFFQRKYYLSLQQAIRFAILHHQAQVLSHLLNTHGAAAFAKAIAHFSARLIADALAMLNVPERQSVLAQLSTAAKHKLQQLDRDLIEILSCEHAVLYA